MGTSLPAFIGLTVILMGGCAALMGQSLANAWRPPGWLVPYGALLGAGDRFLVFALAGGPLWSLSGYLIDSLLLIAVAWIAARMTLAHRMACQYPWRCRRIGLFTWSDAGGGPGAGLSPAAAWEPTPDGARRL